MQTAKFADLAKGFFYLVAGLSLVLMMLMFAFIWQPIWTAGFKDFHTISGAISELNETSRPTAEVAPLLLAEFRNMNDSLDHIEAEMLAIEQMRIILAGMGESIESLEQLNPSMLRINNSVDHMGQVLSNQMGVMNYEVDRMGNKLSPFGMLPFNW